MKLVRALSAIAAAGLVVTVALSFLPFWPCALFEHFRVQYLVTGVAFIVAAYWLAPRWFDAALIAWLVDLAVVAPHLQGSAVEKSGTHVRLLLSNVLTTNPHADRIAALVAETKPDLIALVETDEAWFEKLAPALAGYQRIEQAFAGNFGLGLYARGTVTGKVEHLGTELPTLVADVALASGPRLSFVVTHPIPPLGSAERGDQLSELAAIAARLRTLPRPLVLAGDLNATPWSRAFATIAGGLCDSRDGFGYQGSFPTSSWIVRIPIDHVLTSCDVGVADRRIGPDVGSDHLPVIVDLVF